MPFYYFFANKKTRFFSIEGHTLILPKIEKRLHFSHRQGIKQSSWSKGMSDTYLKL